MKTNENPGSSAKIRIIATHEKSVKFNTECIRFVVKKDN